MNNQVKGTIFVTISAFMWGIMGIFVRGLYAVGYSSIDISFMRCLLAGVILLISISIKNKNDLNINARGLIICTMYGIMGYCLTFICYSISVERLPIAVAIVLMYLSPIWIALISKFIFLEKIGMKKFLIIITCIIGAVLVSNLAGAEDIKLDALGIIAGLTNSIGVALQIMIPKYFEKEYSYQTMLTYGLLSSAIILFLFADKGLIVNTVILHPTLNTIAMLIGIGVLCTLVANGLYLYAAKLLPATTVSIMTSLEVIVAMTFGYFVYNEVLAPLQLFGAFLVISAAILTSVTDKKSKNKEQLSLQNQ